MKGDGIIQKAESATQKYSNAAVNEQAKIDSYTGQIGEYLPKETVVHNGIIPKDAEYITNAGKIFDEVYRIGEVYDYTSGITTLVEGEKFPENPKDGDIYKYGDYEYCYNGTIQYLTFTNNWYLDENIGGWGVVTVEKDKLEYGEILTNINGADVICMNGTFTGCKNFTTAPKIPNTITRMNGTFASCYSLEGEVEINANPITYAWCFYDTKKEIVITGSCPAETKAAIAEASDAENVKY